MCFLCALSPFPPPCSHQIPTKENGREATQGSLGRIVDTASGRFGQDCGHRAFFFAAKPCAFLLQLSEGLNRGKHSSTLIIYCSAVYITIQQHREELCRTEGEFSLSLSTMIQLYLIFPSSSHVVSCGLGLSWKGRMHKRKKKANPPFSCEMWACKTCPSILNALT